MAKEKAGVKLKQGKKGWKAKGTGSLKGLKGTGETPVLALGAMLYVQDIPVATGP